MVKPYKRIKRYRGNDKLYSPRMAVTKYNKIHNENDLTKKKKKKKHKKWDVLV